MAAVSAAAFSIDVRDFVAAPRADVDDVGDDASALSKDELPVLQLEQFSAPPTIDLGRAAVGATRDAVLRVENTQLQHHSLTLEKVPAGFTVLGAAQQLGEAPAALRAGEALAVPPASNAYLHVRWAPSEGSAEGRNVREVLVLKWNGRWRLQVCWSTCVSAPLRRPLPVCARPQLQALSVRCCRCRWFCWAAQWIASPRRRRASSGPRR